MAQIDVQIRQSDTNNNTDTQEQIQDVNENKNGLIIPITSDVTTTNASVTSKSSVRELVRSQKNASHRKSKSQNRARKALRTITFILGKSQCSLLLSNEFFLFLSRCIRRLLDTMVKKFYPDFHLFYSDSFSGISTPQFIHYAILVKITGCLVIQCFIVFIFFAI